jgi:aspartokinase/homoserine dehydrogenase 1
MAIMKFGGSSVADPKRIREVADIVISRSEKETRKPVVVVSAMKGITDTLIDSAATAEAGSRDYRTTLQAIRQRHHDAAKALVSDNSIGATLLTEMDGILDELGEILHGVELVKECSPRTGDLVSGFGERLSCLLVSAHIRSRGVPADAVDAREIIRTDDNHGHAAVDFPESNRLITSRFSDRTRISVVTGFIASTAGKVATTLGRNGSDYTASILGAALGEDCVEIWTDVDGVLTADPRVVPGASVISEISFQEAMELSYFGAEVIHPYTLIPVMELDIPVLIKNTMNPAAPGTRIARNPAAPDRAITGIASIDGVSMVTIEGGGMVGMPGVAGRIFSSVARSGANVIMITQASSEHSVCLVCRNKDAIAAVKGLRKDLSDAIASKMIRDINLTDGLEIIAVIGDNMRGQVGLSGKLFSSLGNAGINILAIAQGSTELNISLVIDSRQKDAAINAIHKTFIG